MPLLQIIYTSTLVTDGPAVLSAILDTSVRNNARDDITGMLLHSAGNVLQVIEGEAGVLQARYARICADPRHKGLIELSQDRLDSREFGQWSMGVRGVRPEDMPPSGADAALFHGGFDRQLLSARPGMAREMLALFSRNMR